MTQVPRTVRPATASVARTMLGFCLVSCRAARHFCAGAHARADRSRHAAVVSAAAGASRTSALDRGAVHGAPDRLRDCAHRRHKSCSRRCHRRAAERDPGRREIAGDREPDRVEQHGSQALRPGRRARDHDTPAAAARALPGRGRPGQRHRRSHHPLGSGIQQQCVAAGRGDRAGELLESQNHQHAAAAQWAGKPAGDAAGAIRRGQSTSAHGSRRELHRQSCRLFRPVDDAAILGAGHRPAIRAASS